MIGGYIAAVVTPFKDGKVDIESFEKYMNYMVSSGISGMVVCGSTGESLSLTMQEKVELVKIASRINSNRTQLFAGVIDASTQNCLELVKNTEEYVDGFLCICPFYVKPSQEQIYNHFKKISETTSKNLILYNNPSRVGTDINLDTFKRASELKNVVAIKECSSDLSRFSMWRSEVKKDFAFLTGNDDSACGAIAMGAHGVISVSANVVPELCMKMFNSFRNQDVERFSALRDMLAPLHKLMFTEPSPAPVKYALSKLGIMSDELREPLTSISSDLRAKIDDVLRKIGLIK